MNFFQHQDRARARTGRLIFFFILIVIIVVLAVSTCVAYSLKYDAELLEYSFWKIFSYSSATLLATIYFASLYRKFRLRLGGKKVAEELSAKLISYDDSSADEKRLINIVEEMSIASGIPVPEVYVINELGINASAAGFEIKDAVIIVTQGALEAFTREEMQGVIAHEFSHIFNGDMLLNLKLTSMIYGVSFLGDMGKDMLRDAFSWRFRFFYRRKKNSFSLSSVAIGISLVIMGAIGSFIGTIIKAMISRQREYLADASAVQFTRNPVGISSALKKIHCMDIGSKIENSKAGQFSHMFFSDYSDSKIARFFNMATHPPLKSRILAIDANWDGEYYAKPSRQSNENNNVANDDKKRNSIVTAAAVVNSFAAKVTANDMGNINQESIDEASDLISKIPPFIKDIICNPLGAEIIIYSLLIGAKNEFDKNLINTGEDLSELTTDIHARISQMDKKFRLTLIKLAIASLRNLTEDQYKNFKKNVRLLIKSDSKVSIFEWSLSKILFNSLDGKFTKKPKKSTAKYSLKDTKLELSLVLSLMAYTGHKTTSKAKKAFETTISNQNLPKVPFTPKNKIKSLSKAVLKLDNLKPLEKEKLLNACSDCIFQNESLPEEAELFAAFAAVLNCPISLKPSST